MITQIPHPSTTLPLQIDHGVMPCLRRMMRVGIAVNIPYLQDLGSQFAAEMRTLEADIRYCIPDDAFSLLVKDDPDAEDPIDFNVSSPEQIAWLLFEVLQLGKGKKLKVAKSSGRLATDRKQLEMLKDENKIVRLLLRYRRLSKLKSTYCDSLPRAAVLHPAGPNCPICGLSHRTSHPRIHTTFSTTRALTGRLACVAPWTPVVTSAGTKRIDQVVVGDLVWTHARRWKPVLDTQIKGTETMYNVTFSTGDVLTCTGSHRLLVSEYVDLQIVGGSQREPGPGAGVVPIGGLPHSRGDRGSCGNHLPQRTSYTQNIDPTSGVQSPASDPVFTIENRGQESYAREDARTTPQLEGAVPGWVRVSDLLAGWETVLCPSSRHGRRPGDAGVTRDVRCSSHRRQQEEQQPGQSGIGYASWSPDDSLSPGEGQSFCRITSVKVAGSFEVRDITVADDESYLACGVFSHNSSNPNLQNIPARTDEGALIRKAFIATPGKRLISCDYSQVELRVFAHCSRDETMIGIYNRGEDLHVETAKQAFGISDPSTIPKDEWKQKYRAPAKTVNFGVAYGMTGQGLYAQLVLMFSENDLAIPDWLTEDWCDKFIHRWFGVFPGVKAYLDHEHYCAVRYGFVWTNYGRVRLTSETRSLYDHIRSEGLRQAGNVRIQGTAADINKLGLTAVHEELEYLHEECGAEGLLSVHDEWLGEADEEYAESIAHLVESAMTSVAELRGGLLAESNIMECWQK